MESVGNNEMNEKSSLFFRILTAREKRVRQKFNSDIELQAYEKRLKDIEKKIRQLVKRGTFHSKKS